jgi:Txe/YoeB family toxin of Txe-Axe toxin-antitoxin module
MNNLEKEFYKKKYLKYKFKYTELKDYKFNINSNQKGGGKIEELANQLKDIDSKIKEHGDNFIFLPQTSLDYNAWQDINQKLKDKKKRLQEQYDALLVFSSSSSGSFNPLVSEFVPSIASLNPLVQQAPHLQENTERTRHDTTHKMFLNEESIKKQQRTEQRIEQIRLDLISTEQRLKTCISDNLHDKEFLQKELDKLLSD